MRILIDAYKTVRQMQDATDNIDERAWMESECEQVCNGLLRIMHEVGGYTESVMWEAEQIQPPGART
jgi:hypothetical protein